MPRADSIVPLTPRRSPALRSLARSLVSALCALTLALALLPVGAVLQKPVQAYAAMDTRTIAMLNTPGVILVQSVWSANVTYEDFYFSDTLLEDAFKVIKAMVESGQITGTEKEIYSILLAYITYYLPDYVVWTGKKYTDPMETAAVGTGFIITPDGYLITNAHVVYTDAEELRASFAASSLVSNAVAFADDMDEIFASLGYYMSEDEWYELAFAVYEVYALRMKVSNLKTDYYAFMGNISTGSDFYGKGTPMKLIKCGVPIPGKDVAILKMEGKNFPTVALGDDSLLRTGDAVYAMGYPAVATINDALNIGQAIHEPTMTSGIISARKEMAGGWKILQTDAAIHSGNSGGPLFNADGEVIGINTFGMIDPNSGAMVAGMNFAVPISIAREFLKDVNVTPSESDFSRDFRAASDAYKVGHYSKAVELLTALNDAYPGYRVIEEFLDDARRELKNKGDNPEFTNNGLLTGKILGIPTLIFVAIVAVVVIIVVVVIILVVRGKKKKAAQQQPAYQQFAYQQPQPIQQQPLPRMQTLYQQPAHPAYQQPQQPMQQQPMPQQPMQQQPMPQQQPYQQPYQQQQPMRQQPYQQQPNQQPAYQQQPTQQRVPVTPQQQTGYGAASVYTQQPGPAQQAPEARSTCPYCGAAVTSGVPFCPSCVKRIV